MALINHEKREVVFKVVYCGPPLSGKTANVEFLHSQMDPSERSDLAVRETSAERTISVDLFPARIVVQEGYRTRFRIYTVSGYVFHNATWQLVMRGADGLVFVADSRSESMEGNWCAYQTMRENLSGDGVSHDRPPVVLQYNQCNAADAVSADYLESVFNRHEPPLPSFQAVASSGYNVLATLNAVSRAVLARSQEVAWQSQGGGSDFQRGGSEGTSIAGTARAGAAGAETGEGRGGHPERMEIGVG